jgi:hypothetical protein
LLLRDIRDEEFEEYDESVVRGVKIEWKRGLKEFGKPAEGFGFEIIESTRDEEVVECCEESFRAVRPSPMGDKRVTSSEEGTNVSVVTMMLDGRIRFQEWVDDCFDDIPYRIGR